MEIIVTYRLRVDGTWELHELDLLAEISTQQEEALCQAAAQMERAIQAALAGREAA